jgi:hypothetical protein
VAGRRRGGNSQRLADVGGNQAGQGLADLFRGDLRQARPRMALMFLQLAVEQLLDVHPIRVS